MKVKRGKGLKGGEETSKKEESKYIIDVILSFLQNLVVGTEQVPVA